MPQFFHLPAVAIVARRPIGLLRLTLAFAFGGRGGFARLGNHRLADRLDRGGLRFSLSHSADRALVATTRNRAIGCDLEALRDVRLGQDLARRIFAPEEFEVLARLEGEAWQRAFFRCWTLKEAWLKARGDSA